MNLFRFPFFVFLVGFFVRARSCCLSLSFESPVVNPRPFTITIHHPILFSSSFCFLLRPPPLFPYNFLARDARTHPRTAFAVSRPSLFYFLFLYFRAVVSGRTTRRFTTTHHQTASRIRLFGKGSLLSSVDRRTRPHFGQSDRRCEKQAKKGQAP